MGFVACAAYFIAKEIIKNHILYFLHVNWYIASISHEIILIFWCIILHGNMPYSYLLYKCMLLHISSSSYENELDITCNLFFKRSSKCLMMQHLC